jgi:diguanylate cyclase (GGDEF)-like protein/PAS domain S-box-containing protein
MTVTGKETKMLLIEDNSFDRNLIVDMLSQIKEESFSLGTCDNLAEGLELLKEGDFDLLLLDLNLPDSEGISTLHSVFSFSPHIPIIVFSAISDEDIALQTVREGAQDYLFKGQVDAGLLSRSIHYAIERKKAQERLKRAQEELEAFTDKRKREQDIANPAIGGLELKENELRSAHDILNILTSYLLDRTSSLIKINNKLKVEVEIRKRTEEALRDSEDRFHKMSEVIPVVFWIYSPKEKKMLYVSPAFDKIYRRSRSEYYSNPGLWLEVIHSDDIERVKEILEETQGTEREIEYRIVQPDGSIRWIYDCIFPVKDSQGEPINIVGFIEDITKRKTIEDELKKLSITDSLTCLFNQRYFYRRGHEEFDRARRRSYPLSVMILDVDDFKNYNDTHGHLAGDSVLREVGEVIKGSIKRDVDSAFRYGGDEFAVILPYATTVESLMVSRRIRENLRIRIDGIGISIGTASAESAANFEEMVNAADKDMYANKGSRKATQRAREVSS